MYSHVKTTGDKKFIKFTYFITTSHKVTEILWKYNLKVTFRMLKKLFQFCLNNKSRTADKEKSAAYKLNYDRCNSCFKNSKIRQEDLKTCLQS